MSMREQGASIADANSAPAPFRAGASALCALLLALFLVGFSAAHPNRSWAAETEGNLVDPTQRADNSFIYDTTIGSLFEQASLYDGRTVQVVGEVIGDAVRASDGSGLYWITLTSLDEEDKSSISVLLSYDQVNQIDLFGRYGVTGTTFQVRGTYHQDCGDHDGLPDIHATNSSVIAHGVEHPDDFVLGEFAPGLLALAIGLGLMALFYFIRERMR